MNTKNESLDDLTQIKGIGTSVQNRLRESLQVQTFADLAALSASTIEADLQLDKSIPVPLKSRKRIEQWLVEAQKLMGTSDFEAATTDVWEPIDSFVLEFQRKKSPQGDLDLRVAVQHVEHDANRHLDFRKQQEREDLFRWMESEANLEQILYELEAVDDKQVDVKGAATEKAVDFFWETDVKPIQVSLIQGDEIARTLLSEQEKRPFLAHIHHEKPLDLEVTFSLPFSPTIGDNSLRYSAQCQIQNLSQNKEPAYLEMGTAEQLGDHPSISAKLSDMSLEPGIYELGILVRGERPLGASYYEFPKLNVL